MEKRFQGSRMNGGQNNNARYMLILVVVLIVGVLLCTVFSGAGWQADLTGAGLYTLSEGTREALGSLSSDVLIYTLYSPGNDNHTLTTLLKQYTAQSGKITLVNVDPAGIGQELRGVEGMDGLPSYGSVTVYCERTGLKRTLDPGDLYFEEDGRTYLDAENKLTAAIRYVSTGEQSRVLLLYEHREKNGTAFSAFISDIQQKNIEVTSYDLLKDGQAPDPGKELLVSVSPRQDFSADELQMITRFIEDGGTFLLFVDAAEYDAAAGEVVAVGAEIPNLTAFINDMGMHMPGGLIYEGDPAGMGIRATIAEFDTAEHALLAGAAGKKAVLGESTPIMRTEKSSARGLIYSSDTAYSAVQVSAPYCVMAVSERGKGRLILASSSSILTMYDGLDNADILGALISSAGIEAGDVIAAKPLNPEPMTVEHGIAKIMLVVLLLLVLPGTILAAGAQILKKRRLKSGD